MVSEAQVIVRAKVREVRCAWVDSPQGRVIKTFVTLDVQKRLKGEATPPGAYTVVVLGIGNTTGNALVEVYDLDP